MYPFAIINSFGSKIERVYRDFALKVNKVLIPALSELLPSPQSHDVVRQIRVSPSPKGRGAASIRLDASNILELLEEIRLNYGDYVDQEKLEKIISENINLLDGWSTSQLNKMISDQNAVLGVGNGFKPFPTGGVDKPVVPLIPRKNVVSMQNIPLANNSQRLLQNDAYSKYFFDVEEIINNGIIDGLNADEITKQILGKVDMNAKRARFWAEDQASIFQAEQTRLKAIREGQTHYKWIAGASARPSHAVHNGQVYSWNVGVNNLSRPGARHPGEDYRCHCKIGLATPEEIAKAGSPPPRAPQSTTGLVENYTGSEGRKAAKGMTDQWAKQNLMNNFSEFEVDALKAWQSGYYKSVDDYLAGDTDGMTPGQKSLLETRIASIDAAIDKSVIPIDLTVMSGVEDFASMGIDLNSLPIGQTVDLVSYRATSLSESIAQSFTDTSKVILEINLPKGSKGVYMNNISKLKPHEKEILLPRNRVYKVLDKYEKNGFTYIKMEVIQ
jgi:SPP1 gp7 family putative phage head morphogenesis protein